MSYVTSGDRSFVTASILRAVEAVVRRNGAVTMMRPEWSVIVGEIRRLKLRRAAEKDRRQRDKLVGSYERVLNLVGAGGLMRQLSASQQDTILGDRFPAPEVSLGDEFLGAAQGAMVRDAVCRAIDATSLRAPSGHDISAQDFFRVALSLRESIRENGMHAISGQLERADRGVRALCDHLIDHEVHRLLVEIDMALAEFTRIDTAIYWYSPEYVRVGRGKGLFRVTIRKSPAECSRIVRDGEPRPAYRCGASFASRGIDWIRLPAGPLDGPDSAGYPLYVQTHAIRNLHERVPIDKSGFVHDAMWQSFYDPKWASNERGQRLVEYRLFQHKLGYFTVEPIGEVTVATTFLFLAMQGTPEATALREKLRLRRRDIEELGLDKLQTYIRTDIQEDRELVEILEKCGCGHLLKMARPEYRRERSVGYARDLRKYLGMSLI